MSKSIKAISFLICMSLLFSIFTFPVNASDDFNPNDEGISSDSTYYLLQNISVIDNLKKFYGIPNKSEQVDIPYRIVSTGYPNEKAYVGALSFKWTEKKITYVVLLDTVINKRYFTYDNDINYSGKKDPNASIYINSSVKTEYNDIYRMRKYQINQNVTATLISEEYYPDVVSNKYRIKSGTPTDRLTTPESRLKSQPPRYGQLPSLSSTITDNDGLQTLKNVLTEINKLKTELLNYSNPINLKAIRIKNNQNLNEYTEMYLTRAEVEYLMRDKDFYANGNKYNNFDSDAYIQKVNKTIESISEKQMAVIHDSAFSIILSGKISQYDAYINQIGSILTEVNNSKNKYWNNLNTSRNSITNFYSQYSSGMSVWSNASFYKALVEADELLYRNKSLQGVKIKNTPILLTSNLDVLNWDGNVKNVLTNYKNATYSKQVQKQRIETVINYTTVKIGFIKVTIPNINIKIVNYYATESAKLYDIKKSSSGLN